MKAFLLACVLFGCMISGATAGTLADCAGMLRMFGDASSWSSSCFVVGDGSWVVTAADAVIEKVGPGTNQPVRHPMFVSYFTGLACQADLKAHDPDLNLALLKLPIKGLPAAPLAQISEFAKAAYGTMGQVMSGEPVGNRWPTEIYGIAREKSGDTYKLGVGEWDAKKVFVTDIGKYKWAFLSDISPNTPIPNGSMVARGRNVVGMYINRIVITGGKESVAFGRCVMSTEIARYLSSHGVDTNTLYTPPAPTIQREDTADAAFQLRAVIYTLIGAGKAGAALDSAQALAKLQPKDAEAQMLVGIAQTGAGKFEEAIKSFDSAAAIDPKLANLRTSRALALVGLKKMPEAEAELTKAIAEAPEDSRPVSAMADFYLGDEKTYDKALVYANKAVNMIPTSPAALLVKARVEKRMKNYKQAEATISEAIKIAPNWAEAYYALGSTLEEAGDKAGAEKAYRKLVELQPKNPDSLMTLASFLADQGKVDEAKEQLTKLRELKPPKEVLDAAKALEDKMDKK